MQRLTDRISKSLKGMPLSEGKKKNVCQVLQSLSKVGMGPRNPSQ